MAFFTACYFPKLVKLFPKKYFPMVTENPDSVAYTVQI